MKFSSFSRKKADKNYLIFIAFCLPTEVSNRGVAAVRIQGFVRPPLPPDVRLLLQLGPCDAAIAASDLGPARPPPLSSRVGLAGEDPLAEGSRRRVS
jgi:hypothetical protein